MLSFAIVKITYRLGRSCSGDRRPGAEVAGSTLTGFGARARFARERPALLLDKGPSACLCAFNLESMRAGVRRPGNLTRNASARGSESGR